MYECKNKLAEIGLSLFGDFILIEKETEPIEDMDTKEYIHTYTAERHDVENYNEDDVAMYRLTFVGNKDNNFIPKFDKKFWAICRIQGIHDEDSVYMSILIVAWSYDKEELELQNRQKIIETIEEIAMTKLSFDIKIESTKTQNGEPVNARRHTLPSLDIFSSGQKDLRDNPKNIANSTEEHQEEHTEESHQDDSQPNQQESKEEIFDPLWAEDLNED
ncbi:MAG: hypothetical protein DRN27_08350 [Thermoplasmata archaeon]|nr:MAG: hypothetical protein DRN27_08350 [Thermoplasmata archaeon]